MTRPETPPARNRPALAARPRRAWPLLLALLAVALAAAAVAAGRAPRPPASRVRARQLYLAAEDTMADRGAMVALLRQAWEADPSYVVAAGTMALMAMNDWYHTDVAAWLDSGAAGSPDVALAACLRRFAARVRHGEVAAVPHRPPPRGAPGSAALCESFEMAIRAPVGDGAPLLRAHLSSLRRAAPESPDVAWRLLEYFAYRRQWRDVDTLAAALRRSAHGDAARALGYGYGALARHAAGAEAEALALEQRGRDFARHASSGARWYTLMTARLHSLLVPARDTALARHLERATAWSDTAYARFMATADAATRRADRLSAALALLDRGRLEESLRAWDALLRDAPPDDAPGFLAEVHARRGRTLVKLGRLREAERELLEARARAAAAGDLMSGLEAEHNLLHLYEAQRRDSLAVDAGRRFLEMTRRGDHASMHLMADHDLAWFLQRVGAADRARPYFRDMIAQATTLDGMAFWAGEYYEYAGELDSARAQYARMTQIGATADRWYPALVRVWEALGRPDSALYYARLADARIYGNGYPERMPMLPGVLARTGRRDEAARAYAGALADLARHGQAAAWAELAAQLALLRLDGADLAGAAALADSAAAAATLVAAAETRVRAVSIAALARARGGSPAAAAASLAALRGAARDAERMGGPALAAEVHERHGAALAALGRIPDALAAYARAATLRDSVARSLAADPLRASFRAAARQASDGALAAILAWRGDEATRVRWFAEWSTRRKGRGIVEAGARAAAAAPSPLQLARHLSSGVAVIDYVVLDSAVAALVVTRDAARVVPLPLAGAALARDVGALLDGLAPQLGSTVDTARAALDTAAAARLYDALLRPLAPILAGWTRLVIVPDGPLHRLPFDVLVAGRDAAARPVYALDRFTISLAPSLELAGAPDAGLPAGAAVIVAGPDQDAIPGARDEVRAVAAALAARAPVAVLEGAGTETALRRRGGSAGLLHVAAHAWANDANPAYARLDLGADARADGVLHAFEIERLRLPGTLVVLSACETAGGRLEGSEGALSLGRAFLRAGASGTVATLWPVGAGAAPLMGDFYRSLAAGRDVATALRDAKLGARRAGRAPFHWASFTLTTGL